MESKHENHIDRFQSDVTFEPDRFIKSWIHEKHSQITLETYSNIKFIIL